METNDQVVQEMVAVTPVAAPGSVPDHQPGEAPLTIGLSDSGVKKTEVPAYAHEQKPADLTLLDRGSLLAQKDLPRKRLYVEAFGGVVCLQEMKSIERDAYEAALVIKLRGKNGKEKREVTTHNIRAKLICRMVIDEAGQRIFTDEDAALLGQLPAADMDRLWTAAQTLSGVTEDDIEELAGNSDSSLGASSA